MSNSFAERANPPPRRKSCQACTRAKRRCDLASPACLRCNRRNITCNYPSGQSRCLLREATSPSSRLGVLEDTTLATSAVDRLDSAPVSGAVLEQPEFAKTTNRSSTLQGGFSDTLPADLGDYFVSSSLNEGLDTFFTTDALFGDVSPAVLPSASSMTVVPSDHDRFPDLGESLGHTIASRLQYSIDELRKAPSTTVTENRTPWSHHMLYRQAMPRCMQDAYACCSLYLAKNTVNAPIILRIIECRASELLTSPEPETSLDALARLHALILYQIIRLFDGDIRSRVSAEKAIPAFESAAMALIPLMTFGGTYPTGSSIPQNAASMTSNLLSHSASLVTPEFWQHWIIQESIRRSVLFSFFILEAYQYLTGRPGQPGDCGNMLHVNSWTFSAHLWNAQNIVDFEVAWCGKQGLVVTPTNFGTVLEKAESDDVDSFGRIFMVGFLGIDEARLWFHRRGGIL